ncbi:Carnitine O-acetyltransferase mitochondrial, partial [Cladochytrium tenue]
MQTRATASLWAAATVVPTRRTLAAAAVRLPPPRLLHSGSAVSSLLFSDGVGPAVCTLRNTPPAYPARKPPAALATPRRRLLHTFDAQPNLPRLPLPELTDTAARYLRSCSPLQSPEEHERTAAAVSEFLRDGGLGEVAQARLRKLDAEAKGSWLEDIWLRHAYLLYREPSMINVNWFSLLNDHPLLKRSNLRKPTPPGTFTSFQVRRAAELVTSMLRFKAMLDSGKLPADTTKAGPLCMNQYRYMFGVCRVPGAKEDTVYHSFPSPSKHIVVVLYTVTRDSLESKPEAPIGLLTAGDRDIWFEAYEKLVKLTPQNAENLEIIHSSLFVLALDDFSARQNVDTAHQQFFHNFTAVNRWFDKTFQLIVASNGRAGINGE